MDIESMSGDRSALQRRARIHAALSDPARLAIADALWLGDASPGEIACSLGLPSNLVAHHVKVLLDAGLVERSRSEADRRRTYLRICHDTLGLLPPPRPPDAGRVVFVCTHNSARSQLAAALWARRADRPAASAGTRPARRVHPRAVRVARRHGLRLDPTGTAHVDAVVTGDDLVIAVCNSAYEDLSGSVRPRLHWSVPDPARIDTDAAFESAYTDLAVRVDRFARAVTGGEP